MCNTDCNNNPNKVTDKIEFFSVTAESSTEALKCSYETVSPDLSQALYVIGKMEIETFVSYETVLFAPGRRPGAAPRAAGYSQCVTTIIWIQVWNMD